MTRFRLLTAALVQMAFVLTVSSAVAQVAAPRRGPFAGRASTEMESSTAGFSVVLVLGDSQTAGASDGVPVSAAKALADLKDFLPYKSYQLLDSQWSMGADRVTSRLRGPEGKEYELQLLAHQGLSNVVISRFVLRELTEQAQKGEVFEGQSRLGPDHPSLRLITGKLPGTIVDTSFSMDVGETVVVGTSRLQGSKALIVLLTAVGRSHTRQSAPAGPAAATTK